MSGDENEDYTPILTIPDTDEVKRLKEYFVDKFKDTPEFYVKVPGRVNLIGEHIDYCGFSVCPIAVQQHILVAVKQTNDSNLHVSNIESKYEDFTCDLRSFT